MNSVVFNFLALLTMACGALVVYHHLIYPVILRRMATHRPVAEQPFAPRRYRERKDDRDLPTVCVVVPAFDEADTIEAKVRNLAALDYPAPKLEVLIVCDGCTDDTAARARAVLREPECRHLRLRVVEHAENRGKVAVINSAVPACRADIVALSDASALVSLDALIVAARHFSDPAVGVVCGTYRLLAPGSEGEEAYWRYQVAIKRNEASLGAPLGAHGAFYLLRRQLFRRLPPDTINDDFVIPMEIVAAGASAVYEPRIIGLELERATHHLDHRRRRRIAAGNVQQAIRLKRLASPRFRGIAFTFLSGKFLRALMPFVLVVLFAGSVALAAASWLFAAATLPQVAVYGLAAFRALRPAWSAPRAIELIHYVVSGHVAGLIGGVRYLLGLDRGPWRRVIPTGETP